MPRLGRAGIFRNRALGTTFLSLALVIVVPACFLILLNSGQLQENIRQRAQDAQRALLEKAADTYDRDLTELYNDLVLLGTDKDLIRIALVSRIGVDLHEHLLRALDRISSLSYTHKAAEQVNVYLPKPNKIYYGGTHDVARFVQRYAPTGDEGAFLTRPYRMSIFSVFDTQAKQQLAMLAHSIPLGGVDSPVPNAQAFVFLSNSEMERALANASMYAQSLLAMTDSEGILYSYIGGAGLASKLAQAAAGAREESGQIKLNGRAYWYILRRGTGGITYLSATPEDIIYADQKKLSGQTALILVLVAALGTLTAFFLSKFFERPIRQLYNLILSRKRDSSPASNPIHYIQKEITGLYEENDGLRQAISKTQMEAERDRLLYRLLMGLDKFQALPRMEGIQPPLVAVCIRQEHHMENVMRYAPQSSIWGALRQYTSQNRLLCVQLASSVMVLACGDMEQACAAITAAHDLAQPYLEGISLRIGVGSLMDDPGKIDLSYRQAMEMLDYRGEEGASYVCYYDDVVQRSAQLHYPVDRENQIINLLVSGSAREAVMHFNEVYRENAERGISEPMRGVLCREFALTLLRAVNAVGSLSPVEPELYDEVHRYVLLDSHAAGSKNYLEGLYRLCTGLADFVNARSRDRDIILRIRTFVREHIHEDISLEAVAMRFGYAPAYFSRYFKKNFGVNLKEYITRERMQIAKSLLTHSADEIQSIAQRVGFQNANSFARTFRQYEGISPSLYRDKKKHMKNGTQGQEDNEASDPNG